LYSRYAIRCAAVLAALLAAPAASEARNNTVTPSITLDTRYDSNVRFRGSRENEDGDFVASVKPAIEFARKGRHYNLRGLYSLTADYHLEETDLNNLSHSAGLNFDAELSRKWGFAAGDRLDFYEDSLRAVGEGILVTRTDILSNTAYASLSRQFSVKTAATITVKDRIQEFDDPQLVDVRTDSAELSATRRYSQTGTANAAYSYTVFDFDTSDSEIVSHGISLGFREAVSSSMNLELGGGVEYANYAGSEDNDIFLTGHASVEKALKNSYMTLMYERAMTTPTGLTDEISIRDSVTFIWDFTVSREISASFFTGLARNRSEPSGRVGVDSIVAEVSGNWQPYRWLILGAGLSHYQQWPEDSFDIGLKRNKVFINATLIGEAWRF
jgi:hypothetical protein